jgi:hypothetical protein
MSPKKRLGDESLKETGFPPVSLTKEHYLEVILLREKDCRNVASGFPSSVQELWLEAI